MVFVHSVKVPTQYRRTSLIFKKAISEQKSIKSLIYEERHARLPNLLALLKKYSKHRALIEDAIETTKILVDNPRLDPYMCRVLVTELLFGTKKLKGESKPVLCVLSYKEKLENCLKSEGESSASSTIDQVSDPNPRYVRINTNLLSPEDVFKLLDEEEWRRVEKTFESYDEYLQAIKDMEEDQYLVDIHIPNVLVFPSKWNSYWACHEYVSQRKLLLQDKATCLVGMFLNPKPNSTVLDMCAAPGMKTIHLSNIMKNTGTIYAVERDESRYKVLYDVVNSANAISVKTINEDALAIGSERVPGVEYILVDPSCSGSGMQRRTSLVDEEKDTKRLHKLAGFQIKLLTHAMTGFPDVKRIVYSTCSLYEEENEQVVKRCLEMCPEFKLLNGKKLLERKWKNVGNKTYKGIGKNCVYALPDQDLTDGIFIAAFEKIRSE